MKVGIAVIENVVKLVVALKLVVAVELVVANRNSWLSVSIMFPESEERALREGWGPQGRLLGGNTI